MVLEADGMGNLRAIAVLPTALAQTSRMLRWRIMVDAMLLVHPAMDGRKIGRLAIHRRCSYTSTPGTTARSDRTLARQATNMGRAWRILGLTYVPQIFMPSPPGRGQPAQPPNHQCTTPMEVGLWWQDG